MRKPYPKFVWFVGSVEDTSSDPLRLGRIRVRAVGFHPSSVESEDLPWAPILNGGAARITKGQMVLGFFMDGEEAQQPCVMGKITGAVTGSSFVDTLKRAGRSVVRIFDYASKNGSENNGTYGVNSFGESGEVYAAVIRKAMGDASRKSWAQLTAEEQTLFLETINRLEGGRPGDLNVRLNNPGSIVLGKKTDSDAFLAQRAKIFGALSPNLSTDSANGLVYAHFDSNENGYQAIRNQMKTKQYQGINLEEIGVTWLGAAPKGGFKKTL